MSVFSNTTLGLSALCLALGLAGCSRQPAVAPCAPLPFTVSDPGERLNRGVFAFNRVVDGYVLKPVARGYRGLPDAVQAGVGNFSRNFGEPQVLVNDLLQGNGRRSLNTLGRFGLNSTLGLVGLFDVAARVGMPHHPADFGQTFGVWGIGNGPTLELPLFGSANSRDALGRVAGLLINPLGGSASDTVQHLGTAATVGGVVDGRAEALPLTDRLEQDADYYAALRDTEAARRARLLRDGRHGRVQPGDDCRADVEGGR
ncbi:MlaA family lipoprotein [Pseudomonas sp. LRF_L74]|uniref:MlaA family lipoprotein n=1 Tax=Pseudomonas sp. LRF_L74 TaxID=3369422 RepID=UPI003F5DA3FB